MIEGLWSVEFVSKPDGDAQYIGAGVVVFETLKVFGGDSSYFYLGDYKIDNGTLNAKVKVKHYFGELNSVLGELEEFTLHLIGKVEGTVMHIEAFLADNPTKGLFLRLTKRAELP